ncbi:uncharacterized protein N7458_012048 [Penicillium daleae]|uniref:Uncharacterized protein n=1 Tax=Penicillium daleae TaxID=63821 RepID=A0AAD6BTS7_9EURO|nr:uncharacterized protein N7458_012048 [Penicillium daleae]KAJ5432892.1 hypothetical protein N7458_012048 [Penicillium daleae]
MKDKARQTIREVADRKAEPAREPFLGNPVTPHRRAGRAFFPSSPERRHFEILEDGEDQESPQVRTPISWPESDENKENEYGPDHEPPMVPLPNRNPVDWSILEVGPRDVFGLPVDFMRRVPLADVTTRNIDTDTDTAATPSVETTPAPTTAQAMMQEDEEMDQDWDESASDIMLRELLDLGYFDRAAVNGTPEDRDIPMQGGRIQAPANIFLQAPHDTYNQRHENRRAR